MYINVLELFEENVIKNPDKIAFQDDCKSMTYEEAYKCAITIGKSIYDRNNHYVEGEVKPIAVCIGRNIESIILFFAVVYSGNFYIPIDASMPSERIKLIYDELNPLMTISSSGQTIEGVKTIDFSEISDTDEILSELPDELKMIRNSYIDTNPLYAIYTSGSTGKPKGVLVNHRSVIDLVEQFDVAFAFPNDPIFGNQAPFDFDVSVKDIYNSLYQHGTVVIIPKQAFSMPLKLIEFINDNKINTLIWAVSAMRIVENFKTFSKISTNCPKLIMFSGEIMPVKVLNYWKDNIPNAIYVNLYGPTEITCNCTYYIVDRDYDVNESLPIGKAFRNTQVILLDRDTDEIITECNKEGELCVRGTCLAFGYYNNKDRTNDSFVQSPLTDKYSEKIYRTGDLAYYGDDGLLRFTSRKDYQIKHMGHRIELGEIEVAVNAIDYIDAAVCVFDLKREKIVLFYQTGDGAEMFESDKELERDIVRHISTRLQKFMWPNVYRRFDCLPINKNGKIDRVKLAEMC